MGPNSNDVLAFWFPVNLKPCEIMQRNMRIGKLLDAVIEEQFGVMLQMAECGELSDWVVTYDGVLALSGCGSIQLGPNRIGNTRRRCNATIVWCTLPRRGGSFHDCPPPPLGGTVTTLGGRFQGGGR